MAASKVNRDVAFFTFGDRSFVEDLYSFHKFLVENNFSVGQVRIAAYYFILLHVLICCCFYYVSFGRYGRHCSLIDIKIVLHYSNT